MFGLGIMFPGAGSWSCVGPNHRALHLVVSLVAALITAGKARPDSCYIFMDIRTFLFVNLCGY